VRLDQLRREIERFGTFNTAGDVSLRALNHLTPAKVLKGVRIDQVNPEFLESDARFRWESLSEATLRDVTRGHPEYEISERFLRESFAKGDECYGFLDGDVLASYGWYSNQPTAIDAPGIVLHFDQRHIYMYKGYTHVKYRGQRLHAVGMTRALQAYLAQGYRGLLSYVEWNNFASLSSCYRMGYQDIGNLYLVRLFGRYFTFADRGCGKYGFRLEDAGTVPNLQTPPIKAS
jgi:hypothetical protein